MKSILENGDMIFIDGELQVVDNEEDIKQCLLAIFNIRKGEFFLDSDLGLDYTSLETKGSSDEEIIADLMDAISQEDRITEIVDITITRNKVERTVSIDIIVKSDDIVIELEEVILDVWDK